jgi:hypothetical protein
VFEVIANFPFSFWIVIALLIGGGFWAWVHRRDGSGIPMLAVLFTACFWYVGDAWYNDYAENHVQLFETSVLAAAWWQVAWFFVVFLVTAPWLHRTLNAAHMSKGSGVMLLFQNGVNQPLFQQQLCLLFTGSAIIWATLALIAFIKLKGQIPYYFFPFLGYKAEPWGRGRIGSGFDALLSVAFYFQLLVTSIFGVVAALASDRPTRRRALAFCLIAMPYFIFDRTRNTMLAAVIPGVLSYGLLRVRGSLWKKAGVLAVCFIFINSWMAFVIANRGAGVIAALKEKGFSLTNKERTRHEGLNMFEELCWINTFMARGTFNPNWGSRYFAEAVNIVPRTLWAGKPLIGIDYAMARGQGGGADGAAGVYATISTGMIGQGVVNFGRLLGPAAAAILMALWVAALGRLDLQIQELGRIPLYATGLILTFNLGRDITLITLYPFVFGAGAIWLFRKYHPAPTPQPARRRNVFRSPATSHPMRSPQPQRHRPLQRTARRPSHS